MEFDSTALRNTVFGEFLKCAMMSDIPNIKDYDQAKLRLEITLDGNSLDLQKLFTMFEARLKSGDLLLTGGPSKEELVRKVELALQSNADLISSMNRGQMDLRDAVVDHLGTIQSLVTDASRSRSGGFAEEALREVLVALKEL